MTKKTPKRKPAAHHVAIKLSTHGEDIMIRQLLPHRSAELVRWLHETQHLGTEEIKALETDDADEVAQWKARELAQQYLAAVQGYVIGSMLDDENLVVPPMEVQTPEERGIKVVEYLYGAGLDMDEITCLFQGCLEVCMRAVLGSGLNHAQVQRHLDFGDGPSVPETTSLSRRASNTTATPTP